VKLRQVATIGIALSVLTALAVGAGGAPTGGGSAHPAWGASIHWNFFETMRKNVVDGKLDYGRLKRKGKPVLDRYLRDLAKDDLKGPSWKPWDSNDRLAFWLNAYNACVIAGIVERYPKIKSVQEVKGFFDDKRWKVAGQVMSLNEIEKKVRSFRDPRIHFVLVCGAKSCPPLRPYAMMGDELQRRLEEITKKVVNDERYVQVDAKAKRLRLTRIMSWYQQDFVDKYGSLEKFLLRYLKEPKCAELAAGGYTIEFMSYDWALNDASGAANKGTAR